MYDFTLCISMQETNIIQNIHKLSIQLLSNYFGCVIVGV